MNNGVEASGTVDPTKVSHPGQKVDILGLGQFVFDCLLLNFSWRDIRYACNEWLKEMGKEDRIKNTSTLKNWYRSQGEAIKEAIRTEQSKELVQQVWDFERAAMNRREEMIDIVKAVLGDPEKLTQKEIEGLEWKDKRLILEAVQTLQRVQESGERFMGIGSKAGNRYGTQTDNRDDLLERVKEVLLNEGPSPESVVDMSFVDKPIDTEAMDIYDKTPNDTGTSVSSKSSKKVSTDL